MFSRDNVSQTCYLRRLTSGVLPMAVTRWFEIGICRVTMKDEMITLGFVAEELLDSD